VRPAVGIAEDLGLPDRVGVGLVPLLVALPGGHADLRAVEAVVGVLGEPEEEFLRCPPVATLLTVYNCIDKSKPKLEKKPRSRRSAGQVRTPSGSSVRP
jgi:hypothetical protein